MHIAIFNMRCLFKKKKIPSVFKQGARCFVAQMNVQKAEMLERLSTARNFSNLDDEDNYSVASKAIRQV